ncbi:methyltransferase [Micromonospora schwarzwaldensis]|uniref:methyltransferase n=1 Tax=Micromonospora sp. DSM 45708 TaxID=3111767 RepID=UPI0031CFE0CA
MSAHDTSVGRWRIGFPGTELRAPERGIAFDVSELGGPLAVGLHQAMSSPTLPRAPEVEIRLPAYRGKSLVRLLNWLVVHRLIEPGGKATFLLEKQQGPASIATLLGDLGWRDVTRERSGRVHRVGGIPADTAELPDPPAFRTRIGGNDLVFAADYGVFSPGHVDEGTRLLAEVALRQPPVASVADIGVGYGPLAVALVRAGTAQRAVGADIDCIALYLAEHNARVNGVPLSTICTADPGEVEDTPLTVCNVPTHIDAEKTAALMAALVHRARAGRKLLTVVHASLETRYRQHFANAGASVVAHHGTTHVVLETG